MDRTCPTERLLRRRELCHVDGTDMQCLRLHCCDTHVFIAGRACPMERLLRRRELCHVDGTDMQCLRLHCCDTHVFIAGRDCPTERLLRRRELCHVDGTDMQCLRLHCCDTHVFIAGRLVTQLVQRGDSCAGGSCAMSTGQTCSTCVCIAVTFTSSLLAACPTERLLHRQELCHVDGTDVTCSACACTAVRDQIMLLRAHSPNNRQSANSQATDIHRCIPKTVDPCSLQLCEQACEVRDQRIWCTCHNGFQFHLDNYRRKTQPYCIDVDECVNNNGGCEQRCVNDPGGYHCECDHPLYLTADGKHCERRVPVPLSIAMPVLINSLMELIQIECSMLQHLW
ncbi:putative collagen and calcium binding EGF domains 1 [Operophtera brumata]|uniref:Putative collagen and calcium binding EGF domains 1 n=1 Tax=Operophtera brumata TaxID=104452 RepID=A0A0L7KS16_OPEBR|nr:putative collagen and calcium binding EGF domains 1 [Operophtera brumata]